MAVSQVEQDTANSNQRSAVPVPEARVQYRSRWAVGITLAGILCAGIVVRTYGLYGRSIWFDEGVSWRSIQFSIPELIARTGRDNHAPLFYLTLKAWAFLFGESLTSLRSMNLVFAALAMVGLYLWASEAFGADDEPEASKDRGSGRWIGLVTAAIYAVSLYQIRLTWEIRMYTLGTALVAFSSWLLFRALRADPPGWKPWVLYGLLTLLSLYNHYFALFSMAGQVVFAAAFLLVRSGGSLAAWLRGIPMRYLALALGIVALGWAPWVPTFFRQRQMIADGWWSWAFSQRDIHRVCYEMLFDTQIQTFSFPYAVVAECIFGLVLLTLMIKARAGEWFVYCMTALPFVMVCAVSTVSTNLVMPRYLAFMQMFLLAGMAIGLSKIPDRFERNMVACVLIVTGAGLHLDFAESLDIPNRPGAQAAAAYIDAHRKPGEPAIAASPLLYFPMLYHSQDRDGWSVYAEKEIPHYRGSPVLIPGETVDQKDVTAITSARVWLVSSSGNWAAVPVEIPPNWQRLNSQQFPEVTPMQKDVIVELYAVRSAAGAPRSTAAH